MIDAQKFQPMRLKRLRVSLELIPHLFWSMDGGKTFKCEGFPADGKCVGASVENGQLNTIDFYIQSEEFDVVQPYQPIPEFLVSITEKKIEETADAV